MLFGLFLRYPKADDAINWKKVMLRASFSWDRRLGKTSCAQIENRIFFWTFCFVNICVIYFSVITLNVSGTQSYVFSSFFCLSIKHVVIKITQMKNLKVNICKIKIFFSGTMKNFFLCMPMGAILKLLTKNKTSTITLS